MKKLSTSAQAVLDASSDAPVGEGWNADRLAIAAALRAVAEQVESETSKSIADEKSRMWYQLGRRAAVEQLVSLAAELETQ